MILNIESTVGWTIYSWFSSWHVYLYHVYHVFLVTSDIMIQSVTSITWTRIMTLTSSRSEWISIFICIHAKKKIYYLSFCQALYYSSNMSANRNIDLKKKSLRARVHHENTKRGTPQSNAVLQIYGPLTTGKLSDALLSHSSRKEKLLFEVWNLHGTSLRIIKHRQQRLCLSLVHLK